MQRKWSALVRGTGRAVRLLSPARALLISEVIVVCGAVLFLLSGSRAAFVDAFGGRADITLLIASLVLLGVLHAVLKRCVVPVLDRRFAPETYDERHVLFDLGQAARAATNIDELYKLIVGKIEEALHVEDVSIFVRDDRSGDYVCRVSSSHMTADEADIWIKLANNKSQLAAESLTLARNSFVVKRLRNLGVPLGIEPRDIETWTRAFAAAAPAIREARKQECQTLQLIKTRLLLQIKRKDDLVGILSLGPRRAAQLFSAEDKRMLMSVAAQLAFIIENSKLVERMVEEERMRRELALASEVQQRLFPAHPPLSQSLDLSGYCQPARGVGGDYYDFLSFDNNQLGIAVADVAGKGIAAALLMSIVQASLRSQAMSHSAGVQTERSLAELVSTMNHLLWRSTGESSYVTFFYAQFDERLRQLTYVNAGHNPPFLIRAKQVKQRAASKDHSSLTGGSSRQPTRSHQVETGGGVAVLGDTIVKTVCDDIDGRHCCTKLTTGGPVIGVFSDCFYEQETVQMESGDLLVAYTDGVTEALNKEGEEFGEVRLQETLAAITHLSADEVRDHVVEQVRAWCVDAPQHDDLTFIVLKVK